MKLKGVVTIVPTPLKSDESFDVLGCKNIAKFLTDKNLPMFCLGHLSSLTLVIRNSFCCPSHKTSMPGCVQKGCLTIEEGK